MDRMLVKIVKEIAEENDIQFNGISDNWIIEIEKMRKSISFMDMLLRTITNQ